MLPVAYWVHRLDPFLVRFSENFGIRWYGIAYIAAFLAGAWLLSLYSKKARSLLPAAKLPDLLTALILGVVVGGRLGHYLLYDGWHSFSSDPLGLLRVWEGGMAFHGGLAGVCIAVILYGRSQKLPILHLADLVSSVAPFGIFLVRLANFQNGELWGKVSEVSWAVIFPLSATPGSPVDIIAPRHPSQLYEAATEGLLLAFFLQWRVWRTSALSKQPGRIAGECLLAYAAARIFCEVFREPDASLIHLGGLSLSRGTFYSFFIVLGGVVLVALSLRNRSLPSISTPSSAK